MGLLETNVKGPVLWTYHNALPGDSVIPTWDAWVFDVDGGAGVRADRPPQAYVNTSCRTLTTTGPDGEPVWKDARWGAGSDELFYTYGERSFDTLRLVAMDARTGATRTVLTETSPTYVEANAYSGGIPNWRVVSGNREGVWFSERDGWGHLYLYDAHTGALKNQITRGPWLVVDLLRVDDVNRWVYFTAVGREAGEDPYDRHLYRARLDGSAMEPLTPEPADHDVRFSPSGRYVVDTCSTRVSQPATRSSTTSIRAPRRGPSGGVRRLPAPAATGPRSPSSASWCSRSTRWNAAPREGLPRRVLREHGGQRHPRSHRRAQGARGPLSTDRPGQGRHLRALRRRLLLDRRDPPHPDFFKVAVSSSGNPPQPRPSTSWSCRTGTTGTGASPT